MGGLLGWTGVLDVTLAEKTTKDQRTFSLDSPP